MSQLIMHKFNILDLASPRHQLFGHLRHHKHEGWGWEAGVAWVVDHVKQRPHVVGIFLGDEPEGLGVNYSQMCQLSGALKAGLVSAGRPDVFTYYNDVWKSGNFHYMAQARSRYLLPSTAHVTHLSRQRHSS